MKRIIFFIFLLTLFSPIHLIAQNNTNEKILLAKELYSNKKYSEAILLFEDLYSNKTSSKIYKNYFDCLLKTNDFKGAIFLYGWHSKKKNN